MKLQLENDIKSTLVINNPKSLSKYTIPLLIKTIRNFMFKTDKIHNQEFLNWINDNTNYIYFYNNLSWSDGLNIKTTEQLFEEYKIIN